MPRARPRQAAACAAGPHHAARVAEILFRQYGESVEDLEVRRASLEDTYMALVRQAEHGAPRRLTAVAA
jgi:ABC-2 type transport system ATP-binding protein